MDGCEMKASFMVQKLQEKQHWAPTGVLSGDSSATGTTGEWYIFLLMKQIEGYSIKVEILLSKDT